MAGEGVSVPALPFGPEPSDQQARTRMIQQALEEISARLQQLSGGSSGGGSFEPETWDGAAAVLGATPVEAGPVTTDHTLAAVSANDLYVVDAVLDFENVNTTQRTATIALQVDPDGVSGFSTIATYVWGPNPDAAADMVLPFQFVVAGQTMAVGGDIRFSVTLDFSSAVELTFTPQYVRGF